MKYYMSSLLNFTFGGMLKFSIGSVGSLVNDVLVLTMILRQKQFRKKIQQTVKTMSNTMFDLCVGMCLYLGR